MIAPAFPFPRQLARSVCWLLALASVLPSACRRPSPPADAVTTQRVTDAFLEQLRAGQFDAAWESTTAEFKSDEGREYFARFVKSKPQLRQSLTFKGYEVADQNGLKRGQCIYEPAPGSKSGVARIRLLVAQDAGQWRVEGVFVD
jgi:hypothetical protein